MTAQEVLKAAVREVLVPNVRAHGYKGSVPTWRRSTAAGDWAVVNLQSSAFNTADHVRCVLNVAVAPEPWLRWWGARPGDPMPKAVNESLGLYRTRLHPTGTPPNLGTWWQVTDEESAMAAASDMVAQLELSGWPVLGRLLSPGGMLDQVRAGDLGFDRREYCPELFARATALLLMDRGPSVELESGLDEVGPDDEDDDPPFGAWVREQARRAGACSA